MKEGWLCPRCRKILAPWVEECKCKPSYVGTPMPIEALPLTLTPSTGGPWPQDEWAVETGAKRRES
jgi:hypothetical protein